MTVATFSPARLWQKHPRELLGTGVLAACALVVAGGAAWSTPGLDKLDRPGATVAPPSPPPLLIRDVAPEQAQSLNQKIPLATGPNPAARPFNTAGLEPVAWARALDCLTSAAYYEAGNESEDGIRAVAQVILNRVRHPAFPSSVCGVVYQGSTRKTGCQFTFTCDGSLRRQPSATSWARAKRIAEAALSGYVYAPAGWATHYHANYVLPYWAPTLAKNAVVGAHLFYRWAGGWGRSPAFTQRYARAEPDSMSLRATSLAAFASRPVEEPKIEVAEVAGVPVETTDLGRVAIRFDLARQAVEKAPRVDYVEKVDASENLRWTLSEKAVSTEAPLGKPAARTVSGPSLSGAATAN